ncbi:MAG: zf-HC2 domain-containing protein [Thermoleophilia bacterium]|nr:zf-HC2 domain-containing protein [Thermoleophilia bacterium]MDH4340851.1 zf-HC2 domain-containing protein [Thermoleophilia bacterium]MDH5281332.1 zf-HC2 domain-containing protein [Thermoleophilia bacterium]
MKAVPASIVCERVRAQSSLRLDGELSQLESRMLAAHLARCSECRAFDAAAVAMTSELRAAPLEPLSRPIVVRRIGRAWMARAQLGVAAAVALVALGTVAQVADRRSDPYQGPKRYPTSSQLTLEVEQIIADGRAFSGGHGESLPL